jgi:hypothetical protein
MEDDLTVLTSEIIDTTNVNPWIVWMRYTSYSLNGVQIYYVLAMCNAATMICLCSVALQDLFLKLKKDYVKDSAWKIPRKFE